MNSLISNNNNKSNYLLSLDEEEGPKDNFKYLNNHKIFYKYPKNDQNQLDNINRLKSNNIPKTVNGQSSSEKINYNFNENSSINDMNNNSSKESNINSPIVYNKKIIMNSTSSDSSMKGFNPILYNYAANSSDNNNGNITNSLELNNYNDNIDINNNNTNVKKIINENEINKNDSDIEDNNNDISSSDDNINKKDIIKNKAPISDEFINNNENKENIDISNNNPNKKNYFNNNKIINNNAFMIDSRLFISEKNRFINNDEFAIDNDILNNKKNEINNFKFENNSKVDEMEIEILLSDNKKEILKFNIFEDVISIIKDFCEKNNFGKEERNIITEEIIQALGEKIDSIEKANNSKRNSRLIKINPNESISTNKSFYDLNSLKNNNNSNYDICHKSFEHNIRLRKNKNKEKENVLDILNSENSPELTFHPTINKKSKEITKNINKNIKVEDRLIALGKDREKRLLKKMVENSFIEDKKHSRNKREKKLTRNKSEELFNKLYKAGNKKFDKRYKIREDAYFKELCPFKPTISKMAQNMDSSKYDKVIKRNYEKNQLKRNDILKEHSVREKFKNNSYKNNKKKNKKIKIEVKKSNKNDDTLIDNKKHDIEIKKEYNKKVKNDWEKHSIDIINQLKLEKYREIFDLLDKDKKNFISYTNISFQEIPVNVMKALGPVIEVINQQKNKRIYFHEFKQLTEKSLASCIMEDDELQNSNIQIGSIKPSDYEEMKEKKEIYS